ncbi:MAG: hypothetical protein HKN36_09480 [Hellea sp.]|nr:hypothetical protein [Hellea sp.]
MEESYSSGSKFRAIVVGSLIGLLVIAFAAWGVSDVFSPQTRNIVLKVGESSVSANDFDLAYRRKLADISAESGVNLSGDQAYQQGVHESILNEFLVEKLIEVDADDLGVGFNIETARKELDQFDAFKDPITEQFSKDQMAARLARAQPPISTDQFLNDIIFNVRRSQTVPAISRGLVAPPQFTDTINKFANETLEVKVLTITPEALPPTPEPTDEELQIFITDNANNYPSLFNEPEYRRITLVRLEQHDFPYMNDTMMRNVRSEEDLRTAFNNIFIEESDIKDQFDLRVQSGEVGSPATRSLVQITATDENNAAEVIQKLESGLSPEEVTTLYGLVEPVTYEDVGEDDIFDPEVGAVAFEMKQDEIRSILGGFDNWVVVQITKEVPEIMPEVDELRPEIVEEIRKNIAGERMYDTIKMIEDGVRDGRTLEESVEIAGVPYATIDFVNRSGQTPDGLKLMGIPQLRPGIGTDEEILKSIFTTEIGFESDYFDTSTGGMAIVRVDDVIEAKPREFDEIRDDTARLWKSQHMLDALDELSLELTQLIRDGQSMKDVAETFEKGVFVQSGPMTRAEPLPGLGQMLDIAIKQASIGDIERGVGPVQFTQQIAKLENIIPHEEPLTGEEAEIAQQRMNAALINDLTDAYLQAVVTDHPQQEFPDVVMSVMGVTPPDQE